jgi:hypothetical protein
MTPTEARTLRPGNLVRALIPVSGGVCLEDGGEIEVTFPAGAVALVTGAETFKGPQGWAVTVVFDNGICNVFDEADADAFPLEAVEDTTQGRAHRAAFLVAHTPDDYPAEELLNDLGALLKAPKAPPYGERGKFRVLVRGMVTGTLVVQAYDETEALAKAEAWTRGSCPETSDLEDYGDCNDWEVEGLEFE